MRYADPGLNSFSDSEGIENTAVFEMTSSKNIFRSKSYYNDEHLSFRPVPPSVDHRPGLKVKSEPREAVSPPALMSRARKRRLSEVDGYAPSKRARTLGTEWRTVSDPLPLSSDFVVTPEYPVGAVNWKDSAGHTVTDRSIQGRISRPDLDCLQKGQYNFRCRYETLLKLFLAELQPTVPLDSPDTKLNAKVR